MTDRSAAVTGQCDSREAKRSEGLATYQIQGLLGQLDDCDCEITAEWVPYMNVTEASMARFAGNNWKVRVGYVGVWGTMKIKEE